MRYEEQDMLFYCKECGCISHTCRYVSSITEWGWASLGRHGMDYESRDSDTNETEYKCEECDYEWSGRNEFDEAQMTYSEALMAKYTDHGRDEMSDEEQADYDEVYGEKEPPEPREGRNTLKCPEEVV